MTSVNKNRAVTLFKAGGVQVLKTRLAPFKGKIAMRVRTMASVKAILCLTLVLGVAVSNIQCAHKPTSVSETKNPPKPAPALPAPNMKLMKVPSYGDKNTVVVDVRSSFDYSVAHARGALSLAPQDFFFLSQMPKPKGDVVISDPKLLELTRRLARLGITPEQNVIVSGYGPAGRGEDGFVVWALNFLGFKRVFSIAQTSLNWPLTSEVTPPLKSAPYWMPQVRFNDLFTQNDLALLRSKERNQTAKSYAILDVRGSQAYLQAKTFEEAINIEWRELYKRSGEVDLDILERLAAVGLTADKHIVVTGAEPISIGAAVNALKVMGFEKVAFLPPRQP